jgi:hypothetical protein
MCLYCIFHPPQAFFQFIVPLQRRIVHGFSEKTAMLQPISAQSVTPLPPVYTKREQNFFASKSLQMSGCTLRNFDAECFATCAQKHFLPYKKYLNVQESPIAQLNKAPFFAQKFRATGCIRFHAMLH